MAFKGKIPDKLVINGLQRQTERNFISRIDEDKVNNRIDNLEVVTKQENTIYSIKPGNNLLRPVKQLALTGEVLVKLLEVIRKQPKILYGSIHKRGNQKIAGNFLS